MSLLYASSTATVPGAVDEELAVVAEGTMLQGEGTWSVAEAGAEARTEEVTEVDPSSMSMSQSKSVATKLVGARAKAGAGAEAEAEAGAEAGTEAGAFISEPNAATEEVFVEVTEGTRVKEAEAAVAEED